MLQLHHINFRTKSGGKSLIGDEQITKIDVVQNHPKEGFIQQQQPGCPAADSEANNSKFSAHKPRRAGLHSRMTPCFSNYNVDSSLL